MKRKMVGILNGTVGAVCYGTNPVFALHMYSKGFDANSVLFYRYITAVVLFGLWANFVKKVPLKLHRNEILPMFFASLMFALSSVFLFMSYSYIDGGIASVILFIYPVFVALIMAIAFGEKLQKSALFAVELVLVGIFLFYKGKDGQDLNLTGLTYVILSALAYAIYMVGIKKNSVLKKLNTVKLTFYVMFFGLSVFVYNLKFLTLLKPISEPILWIDVLMLAILPTIVAIDTLNKAIKLIGPTLAAIVSSLEPVSAMILCVIFFHEQLTFKIILGMIAILLGVLIIVVHKDKNALEKNRLSDENSTCQG